MNLTDYLISNFSFIGIIASAIVANIFPFIPEEIFLLGMGYVAWSSWYYFIYFSIFLIIGFMMIDSCLYFLAKSGNKYVMKYARYFFGEWLDRDEWHFRRNLTKIIFFSRPITYLRFIGPVLAGYYKVPYIKYVKINLCILIIYVPTLLTLGRIFGKQVLDLFREGLTFSNMFQVIIIISIIYIISKLIKRAFLFAFNPVVYEKTLLWIKRRVDALVEHFRRHE